MTNAYSIVEINLIYNISDGHQGFFCVVAKLFCTMSFNYFPYKITTSDPSAASKHEYLSGSLQFSGAMYHLSGLKLFQTKASDNNDSLKNV